MKDANYLSLFPDQALKNEEQLQKILKKVENLCSSLDNDYFRETERICSKMIIENINVEQNRKKLDQLHNINSNLNKFIIDVGKKYYKIIQVLSETEIDVHCFVDIETGEVFKPLSKTTADKKKSFTLDHCLVYCDWRGNYLKK
jgi:hypothetical protein